VDDKIINLALSQSVGLRRHEQAACNAMLAARPSNRCDAANALNYVNSSGVWSGKSTRNRASRCAFPIMSVVGMRREGQRCREPVILAKSPANTRAHVRAGRNVVRRSTIDRSARHFSSRVKVELQGVRDANLLGGPSRQPPGLTPY
jgi:hypothetical protein